MNLVVNDLDMPLIIKVASIQKREYRFILLTMMSISSGKPHLLMKRVMYPDNDEFFFAKELLKR
jgi:hypothetical protein